MQKFYDQSGTSVGGAAEEIRRDLMQLEMDVDAGWDLRDHVIALCKLVYRQASASAALIEAIEGTNARQKAISDKLDAMVTSLNEMDSRQRF